MSIDWKETANSLFSSIGALFVSQQRLYNLTQKDFSQVLSKLSSHERELYSFAIYGLLENDKVSQKFVTSGVLTPQNFQNFFRNLKNFPSLRALFLKNNTLTKTLVDQNILNEKNLKNLFYSVSTVEFDVVCSKNPQLLKAFFESSDVQYYSFIDELFNRQRNNPRSEELKNDLTKLIVYSFEDFSTYAKNLLKNSPLLALHEFFASFFSYSSFADSSHYVNEFLKNTSYMQYLLKKTQSYNEVLYLFGNIVMLEKLLENNFFGKDIVDQHSALLKPYTVYTAAQTLLPKNLKDTLYFKKFDKNLKEFYQKKYPEHRLRYLRQLCSLYQSLTKFEYSESQKIELVELLTTSNKALNIFNQVIENNLENIYDFETLKELLVKDSSKKKYKMNF